MKEVSLRFTSISLKHKTEVCIEHYAQWSADKDEIKEDSSWDHFDDQFIVQLTGFEAGST